MVKTILDIKNLYTLAQELFNQYPKYRNLNDEEYIRFNEIVFKYIDNKPVSVSLKYFDKSKYYADFVEQDIVFKHRIKNEFKECSQNEFMRAFNLNITEELPTLYASKVENILLEKIIKYTDILKVYQDSGMPRSEIATIKRVLADLKEIEQNI